jgi:hypothetical protein
MRAQSDQEMAPASAFDSRPSLMAVGNVVAD